MAVGTRMQQRRATEADWATSGYVLAPGELGVTTDTGIIKIGNGTSPWSELDPAFDSQYLPILGTAANSALLGGVSVDSLVKIADTSVTPTANKYVQRTADGGVKGTDATENDELTSLQQMNAAITAGKKLLVSQTLTANGTLALSDADSIVYVNHSSLTAQVQVTVPPNSSVAYPIGTVITVVARGAGGAKLIPGSGVTLNGAINAMPDWGGVRLTKYSTNTWFGVGVGESKRKPAVKVYRSVGGQSTAAYSAIPYDAIDASETYNPDNEWFSWPGTGMTTARRIIVNKDGDYLFNANFSHSGTPGITWMRFEKMVADATETGGRILGISPVQVVGSITVRRRVVAGETFGIFVGAASSTTDAADNPTGNPNNFSIIRLGD